MNLAQMCIRGFTTPDTRARVRITNQAHYFDSRQRGYSTGTARLRVHCFRARMKFAAWLFVVLT